MGKPYAEELASLRDTYEWATSCEISGLRKAIETACARSLIVVGSGGSLTTAHILSGLHMRHAGRLSSVMTPLEISSNHIGPATGIWLLTAGGGNVDVLNAFEVLVNQEPAQLAILCASLGSSLESVSREHPFVDFFGFDSPAGKDGFLATNTLFASSILLTRAYRERFHPKDSLLTAADSYLHELFKDDDAWKRLRLEVLPLLKRETIIVLYGPQSKAGAIDLESKFSEAALGHVQIADFRNFGHGRHHWLAKHHENTSVLALISSADKELADKTIEQLPRDIPRVQIKIAGGADTVALSSLLVAFHVAGWAGEICGIDPGKPGVPSFGENLYNLKLDKALVHDSLSARNAKEQTIIQRKTGGTRNFHQLQNTWELWRSALHEFEAELSSAVFSAVVLDYDGTIVETKLRFNPPQRTIVLELIRLLEHGITLGIATGRGRSVRKELQACLPEGHWGQVLVGYYNGAEIGCLSDNNLPNNQPIVCGSLVHALDSLEKHPELQKITDVTVRPYQITLELKHPAHENFLWETVNQVLIEAGVSGTTLLRSSHSVDVLAPGVSKVKVVEAVKEIICDETEILKIGDRGRWPGNDNSLLNEPFSLSVDECSPSVNTCWNLGRSGQRGANITLEYLRGLEFVEGKKKVALNL